MDTSVDPCVDFYDFACGNYVKETEIPDDKVTMNLFTYFGDNVIKKINDFLSETINESDNRPFKMAKNLFQLCNNLSKKTNIFQTYLSVII